MVDIAADIDLVTEEYYEERLGHIRKAIHHVERKVKQEGRAGLGVQLDQTTFQMLIASMDVAEVYSPPRVKQLAREMGLRAGWSLELTTQDTDGRAWDFNEVEMKNKAQRRVLIDKPLLLIGSPTCTMYSSMNYINNSRMSKEEVDARFRYAKKHLEFSAKLYQMQIDAGRYFYTNIHKPHRHGKKHA